MPSLIQNYFVKSCVIVLTGLVLSACSTVQTTQGGVVGVDRKQMMMVSSEQINQSSSQTYAKLLAQERSKGTLDRDAKQVNRVRAISQRLIAQTGAFRPEARNWQWEVSVITSPDVNAWCMPGGKMAVYTGLIEKLKVTDDELAAVMGHEIAHALREHARERASEQAVAGAGISILTAIAGLGDLGQKGMEFAYMGLLGLPNSRRHETESDRIGVELAARAGYDPRAAITLWEKMGQESSGEPIKFLSTHPSHGDRIADLKIYTQRVMPLYEQSRKK